MLFLFLFLCIKFIVKKKKKSQDEVVILKDDFTACQR